VRAYWEGSLGWRADDDGQLLPSIRCTVLFPMLWRSLLALLKVPLRANGWYRTRWSWATLVLTLQDTRGLTVSAETVRRSVHEVGWVWKRPKLLAKDDDPRRVERLARIRLIFEQLTRDEAVVVADELDSHLLPKVGYARMPKGTQMTVMTSGINENHYLAGALDLATGALLHGVAACKTRPCSVNCWPVLMPATRLSDIHGSQWSSITIPFITPRPSSSGWPPTRGAPCSGCRPIVLVRTPSSTPLAMCMTCAPANIRVNASGIWWPMSKRIPN
jgi:hypothetical protein